MIDNRHASNFHLGHRKTGKRTRRGHTERDGGTLRNIDMAHGSAWGV